MVNTQFISCNIFGMNGVTVGTVNSGAIKTGIFEKIHAGHLMLMVLAGKRPGYMAALILMSPNTCLIWLHRALLAGNLGSANLK